MRKNEVLAIVVCLHAFMTTDGLILAMFKKFQNPTGNTDLRYVSRRDLMDEDWDESDRDPVLLERLRKVATMDLVESVQLPLSQNQPHDASDDARGVLSNPAGHLSSNSFEQEFRLLSSTLPPKVISLEQKPPPPVRYILGF